MKQMWGNSKLQRNNENYFLHILFVISEHLLFRYCDT